MDLAVVTVARSLPRMIRGGMEEAAWNLCRALAKKGLRVSVITSESGAGPQVWEEAGVTVHEIAYVPERLRAEPKHRWWRHFGAAASAYAARMKETPDIVHVHSMYADGFLARPNRPRIVTTVHGTPYADYWAGARDSLIREAGAMHPVRLVQRGAVLLATAEFRRQLRYVDAVVAVSEVLAASLPGVSAEDPRVSVIPHGVDPALFEPIARDDARQRLDLPQDRRIVLFVGRIQAYKGAARLLEALHALPDILLIIAGDGPDFGALRATVGSHVARDRVRVLGGVTDETRRLLLAAANLVCLPSRNEGLPLSLLEAMAMGTPVATTRPWLPRELHPFANFGEDPVRLVRDGLALSEGLDPRRVRAAIMGRFTWDHIGSAYATLFGRVWSMGR